MHFFNHRMRSRGSSSLKHGLPSNQIARSKLPDTNVEVLFGEVRRNNSSISKLAAGKRGEGSSGRVRVIELDEDLAHAGRLSTAHGGTWNLDVQYLAVLLALLLNIFHDF